MDLKQQVRLWLSRGKMIDSDLQLSGREADGLNET